MLRKIITSAIVGAASVALLAQGAQAHDWQGRGGYGPGRPAAYAYGGHGGYAPAYGGYAPRHHDRGRGIATGVAIGVGALVLGSILANQAHSAGYRRY